MDQVEAPAAPAVPVTFGTEIFEARFVNGKKWIPPKCHSIDARLVLVLSHPSHDDLSAEELLSEQSQYRAEIYDALSVAGIPIEDVYITTMVKYGIGSKSKPTKEMIEECSAQLDHELSTLLQPKLIMTMGAEVFKRVMKTTRKQGDYLGEIVDSPYGKMMANFSPGMILNQDPKLRPEFRNMFVTARRFLNDNLHYRPFTYHMVHTAEENRKIIEGYLASGNTVYVGYDGEWCGKKMTEDEVMYTFQYSCEPDVAYVLDISADGQTENRELLDSMKLLLEHPNVRRLGWNIRADDKRLILRGFNLPEETLGFDGMKACAFFDSRISKGLETGIRMFTDYEPYYNDLYRALERHGLKKHEMGKVKFQEPDVFYRYCAGDAVAHREACMRMMRELPERQPQEVVDLYYNTYLPLSNYFCDLEMNGIPIDVAVMTEITEKYSSKYNELLVLLREMVAPMMPDFNPASAPAKKELLYTHLKLDPPYYTKSGKSPKPRVWYNRQRQQTKQQYSPSGNNKSLSTLKFELQEELAKKPENNEDIAFKLKVVSTLLALNRVGVFANKFLSQRGVELPSEVKPVTDAQVPAAPQEPVEQEDEEEEEDEKGSPLKSSYWAAMSSDGKIHADFFECLANFRSSSRPNVQNPASKVLSHIPEIFVPGHSLMDKDEQKKVAHLIPRNLRHIFYSGHPDWYWAEVDVAGADLAIAGFLSGDPDYINDLLQGNFHLKKAREYFRDDSITKDDTSRYVSAKSITFRVSYTAELQAAAIPIQSEIYAESGVLVKLEDIEYALNTWTRYRRYMAYREECKAQVDELGYIRNARGLKYHFEQTENFGIKAGWYNESLAFPVASELAWFLWDISVSMKKYLKEQGVWQKLCKPVNSVHDASYWLVHKDLMKDNWFPDVCKHFFTNEIKIATGHNLGMEMVVADRWKSKSPVFSNETKWNFEARRWDWKH